MSSRHQHFVAPCAGCSGDCRPASARAEHPSKLGSGRRAPHVGSSLSGLKHASCAVAHDAAHMGAVVAHEAVHEVAQVGSRFLHVSSTAAHEAAHIGRAAAGAAKSTAFVGRAAATCAAKSMHLPHASMHVPHASMHLPHAPMHLRHAPSMKAIKARAPAVHVPYRGFHLSGWE